MGKVRDRSTTTSRATERTEKGFQGKRKGFKGKGKGNRKGHEQEVHRNEGDLHDGLIQQMRGPNQFQQRGEGKSNSTIHQEQGHNTAPAQIFHDLSSIFSSTPILQPAWAQDPKFKQVFFSTPVVEPVGSRSNSFSFQRYKF